MPWAVDILEPCSIDVFQTEIGRPFHAFIFWNGTKECAHATASSPAKAISQAYVKRCSLWLGDPGEPLHPASVIEPAQLIETSRWSNLWLAIPCCLLIFIAWLAWRLV